MFTITLSPSAIEKESKSIMVSACASMVMVEPSVTIVASPSTTVGSVGRAKEIWERVKANISRSERSF